jgi:chemotaxis signal transduction protein
MDHAEVSLRDFQSNISALASSPSQMKMVIALRVNGKGWIVDASELSEALVAPAIARMGRQQSGVRGIVATRGKVSTVLDMQVLLLDHGSKGMDAPEKMTDHGWLTLISPEITQGVALWWPELAGMFSAADFVPASFDPPAQAKAIWRDRDGEVWRHLDVDRLLRDTSLLVEEATQ